MDFVGFSSPLRREPTRLTRTHSQAPRRGGLEEPMRVLRALVSFALMVGVLVLLSIEGC